MPQPRLTEVKLDGCTLVTKAIRLRQRFRRQYPGEKPEQIWKRVYLEAILGYASMDRERQRAKRLLLREWVRGRGSQPQTRTAITMREIRSPNLD